MKNNFIQTRDEDTARLLLKLGFQEVMSFETDVHIFVNDKTLRFSGDDIDRSKISYSNTLYF